jgi:hypothetical protein
MKQFKRLNNITGWVVFVIAAFTFIRTIEPTVSWWDPGEHISTAYKLQIGHPPGYPTFGMAGRFFSMFAFGDTTKVALMTNMLSALSSAFAVLFLFWTITMMARKLIATGEEITKEQIWKILAAGVIGALALTFSDSFWFSAVEANVFAMSLFCTSVVIWAIFKWEMVADQKHHYRWLIFIGFMIGISIGVHLLNLLTIPALAFVLYFKKFESSRLGIFLTLVISFFVLAFIMYYVIPWTPMLAGKIEILFVNGFGLPFNAGTIFYFALLIGLIVWGLYYTRKTGRAVLNTIILCFTFFLIGYTTYLSIVIRANADTPINENSPKDIIGLVSMLNREQYGTWPLFYGPYYNAPIIDYDDGNPVYRRDDKSGKYIVIDDKKGTIPVYDPRFCTVFPRMWSSERKGSAEYYKNWGGRGTPITVTNNDGKEETLVKHTLGENLKFFFSYQIGWMYIRYLMWNFVGRQNDVQGFGGPQNGNWVSGIPFIDNWHLGNPQTHLPDSMKSRANNTYYFLPLLLGLLGFLYQAKNDSKRSIVVTLLFLMTGLAIVIYLNQKPFEPRERDYSYSGSAYAFCMWIGLGVLYLIELAKKYLKKDAVAVGLVFVICLFFVPVNMAKQNWDDHDRSGKYATRDFAANYLNSCDKDAILFTNGDNDTFPLWYDQEVEGIRTDVRVVNLMLASGSWYIDQMFRRAYDSPPLPFTITREQYQPGNTDIIPFYDVGIKGYVDLHDFIDFIKSDDPQTFLSLQNGNKIKFFPSKKIKLAVDSAACIKYGIVPKHLAGQMVDTIYWTIKSNQLYKNDIMLLDLVATSKWKRPIYFASSGSVQHCFNVDSFCLVEGWVYKFMPVKSRASDYINGMGGMDEEGTYDIIMNKCAWGNLNDPHVYVDPESLNNAARPKTNILRAAQAFITDGKPKKAVALMDLYIEKFPDSKITFDMYMVPFAELYYKAGEFTKANKIMERVTTIFNQDLEYYYSFRGKQREYFDEEIQQSLGVLRRMSQLAGENNQKQLAAKIDSIFQQKLRFIQ